MKITFSRNISHHIFLLNVISPHWLLEVWGEKKVFLSSFVFFPLSPVHCYVICSSFSFALVPFLCYNSHLLFLSRALISHVAVSRQLQTHTYTHNRMYSCTCTGMEVIKGRSKVCLITQLQWKLLVCFMHWYQKEGGREIRRGRGETRGVE